MGKGYKHGAGGTSLNFAIKGYPSETELKADTPKENTMCVITTTTISSWIFSATEPTEPEAGMVWFNVGTSSNAEFNALRKNAIQVCPSSAKQYIYGKWTLIEAHLYQNGEWVQFSWKRLYLYRNGDKCESETGGWSRVGDDRSTVTFGTSSITMDGGAGYAAIICTKNSINLSNYSKLYCTCKVNSTHEDPVHRIYLGVTNKASDIEDEDDLKFVSSASAKLSKGSITLDCDLETVSSGIVGIAAMYAFNINVLEIWAE